ncbi:MAG: rhomboid family intramembrane serine protease [Desulfobacterales bacterium]
MLIIPITGSLSWRNPPWVTLLLILINAMVFFGFQGDDNARYEAAHSFYLESGLAEMEVARYLAEKGTSLPLPEGIDAEGLREEDRLVVRAIQMRRDADFIQRLESGNVIRPGEADYPKWRQDRQAFEDLQEKVVSVAYGYRPAAWRPVTLLTSQFLHGGIGHLIGNMVFLWLFGCMLEMGLGRPQFLAIYLLSGAAGNLFFGLFNLGSSIPLVGASGAIAGLMGALTTTYGRSKVTFFFTSGFYFASFRMPAIALLPFWLGKEIYAEWSAGGIGNIAFMAHAGGILAGALLGWIAGRMKWVRDADEFREPPGDDITPRLQAALDHMAELRFEEARSLLREILSIAPDHTEAAGYLFNIEKHRPNDPAFHAAASAYLRNLIRRPAAFDQAHGVYTEYIRLAKSPRLKPDLFARLSMAFSDAGHTGTSGRIVSALVKKAPDLPELPTALLKLSSAYQRKGQSREALQCRRLICQRYPGTSEARIADRLPAAGG